MNILINSFSFKDKNIDVLITVGELSKNIAAGVRTVSVCDVHSYDTKDELEKDFSKYQFDSWLVICISKDDRRNHVSITD